MSGTVGKHGARWSDRATRQLGRPAPRLLSTCGIALQCFGPTFRTVRDTPKFLIRDNDAKYGSVRHVWLCSITATRGLESEDCLEVATLTETRKGARDQSMGRKAGAREKMLTTAVPQDLHDTVKAPLLQVQS